MDFSRRQFVKTSFAVALACMAPGIARASLAISERKLRFYNTHTGESLQIVYWQEGTYNPEALQAINHVLRDHRTNEIHPIDTSLLDLLETLHRRVDSRKPFEVISGYRSPKSNAMLRERSSGVAVKSLHMTGMAIDIRLADRSLYHLRDMAWDMQKGGVGYYPASDFVHVDTGPIRRW